MNLKTIITLVVAVLLSASCGPHIYTPALYHQDIAYQPKPSTLDSVKTLTYISGAYNIYPNSNLNDQLESGQVNLSRGYIFNHFNLAYGASATFGDYENNSISPGHANYFQNKYWGAVGGRVSANLFANDDGNDYRYLGFEAAYSHEFGPFANFRKYLYTQQGYYVDARTDLFSIGLTTEIIIQSYKHKKIRHGLRFFEGTTLGFNNLINTFYNTKKVSPQLAPQLFETGYYKFFPRITYFLKIKNYFGTAEYYGDGLSLRFGYAF